MRWRLSAGVLSGKIESAHLRDDSSRPDGNLPYLDNTFDLADRRQLSIGLHRVVFRSDLDKLLSYGLPGRPPLDVGKAAPAAIQAAIQMEGLMQPDTSSRVTPRNPLIALTFRISRPIRSHQVMVTDHHGLNSTKAATPSVSRSNCLSLLPTLTLLAALISCGSAPSEEASRSDVPDKGIGSTRGPISAGTSPFVT